MTDQNHTMVLVTRFGIGTTAITDTEFGVTMLDKFFHALERPSNRPAAICFYTEGVKALEQGNPCEVGLRILQRLGVRLVACQSCVNHYGLAERLITREVQGMPEIVQWMSQADKIITV